MGGRQKTTLFSEGKGLGEEARKPVTQEKSKRRGKGGKGK